MDCCFLSISPRSFCESAGKYRYLYEHDEEKLFRNSISREPSSGHVECNFDNSPGKFPPEDEKNWRSMPIKNKESKTVLKKITSQKCCPGHVDCIVDNTAVTVRPEGRKSFADVRKHFQSFCCEICFPTQNKPLDT